MSKLSIVIITSLFLLACEQSKNSNASNQAGVAAENKKPTTVTAPLNEPSEQTRIEKPNIPASAFMKLLMALVNKHEITLLFVSHDVSLSHYFSRIELLSDINHAGNLHAN